MLLSCQLPAAYTVSKEALCVQFMTNFVFSLYLNTHKPMWKWVDELFTLTGKLAKARVKSP